MVDLPCVDVACSPISTTVRY